MLGDLRKRFVDPSEMRLELGRAGKVCLAELPPDLALPQAKDQLGAGSLVDRVPLGSRSQLGAQRDQLVVLTGPVDEHGPEATMEVVVEVLGSERLKLADELGVRHHRSERVALLPISSPKQTLR